MSKPIEIVADEITTEVLYIALSYEDTCGEYLEHYCAAWIAYRAMSVVKYFLSPLVYGGRGSGRDFILPMLKSVGYAMDMLERECEP